MRVRAATRRLSHKAKKIAQKHGLDAKVFDMADADMALLAKAKNIVVFAATWGEGDPPSRAVDFYQTLMSDAAPRIDGVRFAVLALGDTAYAQFCAVGRAIDARLEELGGVRAFDRADLDLDYAKQAADWTDKALGKLAPKDEQGAGGTVVHVDFGAAAPQTDDDEAKYTAEHPLEAEISTLINLNGTGSTRETWHAEFTFDDPAFTYQPGDAIGMYPENDPALVDELLQTVGLGSDAALLLKLQKSYDVTTLSRSFVENYAKLTGRSDAKALLEGEAYPKFAADRQLIDFFATYPEKLTAEQLTGLLRPLPGRLYSVASSLKAHPGEAHLLVGAVRWQSHGRVRKGVSSTFLGERRKAGQTARIYVKPNRHYRLPPDGHTPIIMIGAGTGIARIALLSRSASPMEPRARAGCFSASGTSPTTSSISSSGKSIWNRVISRGSTSPSLAISRRRFMCSIDSGSVAMTCALGWRRARTSMFAATSRVWPRTSTRCWSRSSPSRSKAMKTPGARSSRN